MLRSQNALGAQRMAAGKGTPEADLEDKRGVGQRGRGCREGAVQGNSPKQRRRA